MLSFRNPHADAVLFLKVRAEGPAAGEPWVSAGSARTTRRVGSQESTTLAIRILATDLGGGPWSDLMLTAVRDHGEVPDRQTPLLSMDNVALVPLISVDHRLLVAPTASASAAEGDPNVRVLGLVSGPAE